MTAEDWAQTMMELPLDQVATRVVDYGMPGSTNEMRARLIVQVRAALEASRSAQAARESAEASARTAQATRNLVKATWAMALVTFLLVIATSVSIMLN